MSRQRRDETAIVIVVMRGTVHPRYTHRRQDAVRPMQWAPPSSDEQAAHAFEMAWHYTIASQNEVLNQSHRRQDAFAKQARHDGIGSTLVSAEKILPD